MRPRLLPVLIVVAMLGVVFKLGEIWQGLSPLTQVMAAPAESSGAAPARAAESAATAAAASEADTASRDAGRAPTAALPTDPFNLTDEESRIAANSVAGLWNFTMFDRPLSYGIDVSVFF